METSDWCDFNTHEDELFFTFWSFLTEETKAGQKSQLSHGRQGMKTPPTPHTGNYPIFDT